MSACRGRRPTRTRCPTERQPAVRGLLALRERAREVAVDAHHLAGRAHLRAEHGVDDVALLGAEPLERQHGLLHRDRRVRRHVAAVPRGQQPAAISSAIGRADHDPGAPPSRAARRAPSRRTARSARRAGWPRARRARPSATANCTFIRPRTPMPCGDRERRVAHLGRSTSRPSVTGGRVQAESPEWMPASSMCSITPPIQSRVPS